MSGTASALPEVHCMNSNGISRPEQQTVFEYVVDKKLDLYIHAVR